jgi:hypothetical protein
MSAAQDHPDFGYRDPGPEPEVKWVPGDTCTEHSPQKIQETAAKTLQYVTSKLLKAKVREKRRQTAAQELDRRRG